MNTKTVRLDDDTRRILRMCSIKQVGAEWTLDLPQLDRKDYVKAKKALTLLGCIWNRERGTHICSSNPASAITGVINGDDIVVEQYDFFPTPLPLVERMVRLAGVEYGMHCLEPSAGDGRIARAMLDCGAEVSVIELNPAYWKPLADCRRYKVAHNGDFLEFSSEYNGEPPYHRIVMNPPFSKEQDIQHVLHAYELLRPSGRIVAIMSEHAWIADNRRCSEFREWLDEAGWSEELPRETFKESGTMIATRLVVIDKPEKKAVVESVVVESSIVKEEYAEQQRLF